MKSWHKYLVYVSLVFLAAALYRANFLYVPQIFSGFGLAASFLFLFAGFILNAISWKQMLQVSDYAIRLDECIAGFRLSIFGKYIPGKIWTVMGRAAYISEKNQYPLAELSAVSLNTQFIAIWLGLIFGMIGIFALKGWHLWSWMILCTWVVLTVVIFSRFIPEKAEQAVRKILRKDITIPKLSVSSTIAVMPWFIGYWTLWSIGFYCFVASLTEASVLWTIGLGFPLAGTLGIITFISPGGLGTREAIMAGYLTLAGIPLMDATTVAVASRFWFLSGEIFIFLIGWIIHRLAERHGNRSHG
jgi:hypothetical protein